MMTCTPCSLFSWNFRISGASRGPTALDMNIFSEQGRISSEDGDFHIQKHGAFSGNWTLERSGAILAEAKKPSAFLRSFAIRSDGGSFSLQAESAFTRCYAMKVDDEVIGSIRPAHALTRRSYIDCSPRVPELTQIFSFWLAAMTWRRASNNNNQ